MAISIPIRFPDPNNSRLWFWAFLLCPCLLLGQEQVRLVDSLTVKGELIAVDRLQQLYVLTEEDQLWKLDRQGNSLFQFSDNTLGPVSQIDVTDPFNVVVFYQAYQLAKVLDRTLNPNIAFDFGGLGLYNVQSIATGVDNTIWAYDQQEGKVFQLDQDGAIMNESQDLAFLTGRRPDSCRLLFNKNELWLVAKNENLHRFNPFGQYQKSLNWEDKIEDAQLWKERLLFFSNERWYILNPLLWNVRPLIFPGIRGRKIFFINNNILLQKGRKLYFFELK